MNKTLLFLKDTWGIILSILIIIGLTIYAVGCKPTTPSLIDPTKKVDVFELQTEIDTLMLLSKARFDDLQRQNEFRDFIFNQTIAIAESGQINPLGLITTLAAIFGVGSTADNVRLRKQRKRTNGFALAPTIKEET